MGPQQSLLKMESGLKQWAGGRKYGGKDLHNVLAMGGGEVGKEATAAALLHS